MGSSAQVLKVAHCGVGTSTQPGAARQPAPRIKTLPGSTQYLSCLQNVVKAASAKNRDALLVDKGGIKAAEPAANAPAASKKAAVKVARAAKVAKKAVKPAGKRLKEEATAATAKAAGRAAATKDAAAKRVATKKVARPKSAAKKSTGRKVPATAA